MDLAQYLPWNLSEEGLVEVERWRREGVVSGGLWGGGRGEIGRGRSCKITFVAGGLGLIGAAREPVAKKVVRRRRVVGCIVVDG